MVAGCGGLGGGEGGRVVSYTAREHGASAVHERSTLIGRGATLAMEWRRSDMALTCRALCAGTARLVVAARGAYTLPRE